MDKASRNGNQNQSDKENSIAELITLLKQVVQSAQSNISINSESGNSKDIFSSLLAMSYISNKWVLDSGANRHVTGNLNMLCNYRSDSISHVKIANDNIVSVVGHGTLYIFVNVELKNILYFKSDFFELFIR